jgi:F-type H+-transporting ATPase subunit gamma
MPVLKELRKRINTVKSTKKITKAMKMVAASKLRKASNLLESSKLYHYEIEKSISQIIAATKVPNRESLLLTGKKNIPRHLYIVGGAEKGLCGGFNSNLVKFLNNQVSNKNDYSIICLNNKIYSLLKGRHKDHIIDVIGNLFSKNISYRDIKNIVEKILNHFHSNEVGSCSIIYHRFHSILSQEVTEKFLIPLKLEQPVNEVQAMPFEYEPKIELVLEELLRKNLEGQIYYSLLENDVSEHGSRMNAMDNATRNADKMIKDLTLEYNISRQANITKELIEIISGSEAL